MIDLKLLSEVPDDQLEVIEKSIAAWIRAGKPKILGLTVEANTNETIAVFALIAVASVAWGFATGYISDRFVERHRRIKRNTKA